MCRIGDAVLNPFLGPRFKAAVVTTDLPGRHFVLQASRLGSLDIGAPVYYRQIKVGQVVGYLLKEDGMAVDVKIFVNAPFDKYVFKNTRFWSWYF